MEAVRSTETSVNFYQTAEPWVESHHAVRACARLLRRSPPADLISVAYCWPFAWIALRRSTFLQNVGKLVPDYTASDTGVRISNRTIIGEY
jgi:hypothetical protein